MDTVEIDFGDLPETPTINPTWQMDTQELVYQALGYISDRGDCDDDCDKQIIQRLLIALRAALANGPDTYEWDERVPP